MAHGVFLGLLVGQYAGFLFFAGHLGGKELFRLLEFGTVLIRFLVPGILEVCVCLFFGGLPFQRRSQLGEEYVIRAAVKHQMVEIGHQVQLGGRLYDIEAV